MADSSPGARLGAIAALITAVTGAAVAIHSCNSPSPNPNDSGFVAAPPSATPSSQNPAAKDGTATTPAAPPAIASTQPAPSSPAPQGPDPSGTWSGGGATPQQLVIKVDANGTVTGSLMAICNPAGIEPLTPPSTWDGTTLTYTVRDAGDTSTDGTVLYYANNTARLQFQGNLLVGSRGFDRAPNAEHIQFQRGTFSCVH